MEPSSFWLFNFRWVSIAFHRMSTKIALMSHWRKRIPLSTIVNLLLKKFVEIPGSGSSTGHIFLLRNFCLFFARFQLFLSHIINIFWYLQCWWRYSIHLIFFKIAYMDCWQLLRLPTELQCLTCKDFLMDCRYHLIVYITAVRSCVSFNGQCCASYVLHWTRIFYFVEVSCMLCGIVPLLFLGRPLLVPHHEIASSHR